MPSERFLRLEQMIGPAGLRRLQAAHVAVVGLGAVGSYATEALARSGVGALRLVDHDVIRPSNTNRQLYALESTLGLSKVEVAAQRVRDINPQCRVEPLGLFAHVDTLPTVLAGPPDLVIDAIDACTPKLELLAAALRGGVRTVSSMGAALRTDPRCVRTGWLGDVSGCPLARRVRKGLRNRGLTTDILCVYSDEPLVEHAVLPPEEAEADSGEYARGRPRRVLGSLPTMTAIFGLTVANVALRLLLGELFPRSG